MFAFNVILNINQRTEMKMIKAIVFSIVLLIGVLPATAQRIYYSEPDRDDLRSLKFEVLGKYGENYLVYKNIRSRHFVSVYDAAMKQKDKVELDFIPDRAINVDVFTHPDHSMIIYQFQKKNVVYCMGVMIDGAGKKIGEPLELDTTQLSIFSDNKIYSTIISDDKQKLMVFKMKNRQRDDFNIQTLLLSHNLMPLRKSSFNYHLENSKEAIADFYLDPLIFHADGSGVGAVTQRTFSWQVNNGQVSLSMSDDSNVVLEIIDQSGTDFQVFTTVYDTTDRLLAAQAEYAFRVQEGIAINLLINGEEKYWQTMINSEGKDSWDNGRVLFCPGDPTCENTTGVFSPFFGWDFNQDNTGNRILAPYPLTDFPPALDPKASSPPFTWSPSEGGQISMLYSSGNQLRHWLPLKVEQGVLGRRLYVREEAFSFGNLQIAGRIGMYEEIDYEYWNITAPQHATGLNVFKQQRHVVKRSKLMPLTK